MSFSAQIPGSISWIGKEFGECEVPSAGGVSQKSCYSFVEKISGLANPVSLQHDVMYANAFAVIDRIDQNENETCVGLGCVGHQPDKEFPLESKTTVPLPLIMYPTSTNGNELCEVDMCAKPVLNWEAYMRELKITRAERDRKFTRRGSGQFSSQFIGPQKSNEFQPSLRSVPEDDLASQNFISDDGNPKAIMSGASHSLTDSGDVNIEGAPSVKRKKIATSSGTLHDNPGRLEADCKIIPTLSMTKVYSAEQDQDGKVVKANPPEKSSYKDKTKEELTLRTWARLKNQPKLRIESTWNHMYGGHNGACCFMKDAVSKKLHLYLGKGSQLRDITLKKSNPSSIFSYTIDSIWDEDPSFINSRIGDNTDPFNELIFQIVPNETNRLIGVRRGRSIQLYNTEDKIPVLLETIPNILYGTSDYHQDLSKQESSKEYSQNPLLRGFDFNPTFGPEIVTIDENKVIRVCNIYKRSTVEMFVLPQIGLSRRPAILKGYPDINFNDAVGVEFSNYDQVIYAWADSIVYMVDRRPKKYSRRSIAPLFDLRNHVHSHALTSQIYFHEAETKLNEYISCVRKSKRDSNYYYVGSTSKIYLMDLRAPSHPVTVVNHGLQSPPAYMDVCLDDNENFEKIVIGSQRSSETVCMVSDLAHLECLEKPGCKARNPLLYCYPKHLLSPRNYFDKVTNEGYDFSHPVDNELVKSHCNAWSSGMAVNPMISGDDCKLPEGMLIATSNNFGDVFWQEWGQKPLPSHRKNNLTDYKMKKFLTAWHESMKQSVPQSNVRSESSKNSREPGDCTLLLEPLANEIEKLTKVRDVPFNCFKPNQVQHHACVTSMTPISDLLNKFSKYKNPYVKGILDVWRLNEHNEIPESAEVEQVNIKVEPQEWLDPPSPSSVIELSLSDDDAEHAKKLVQIENSLPDALNFDDDDVGQRVEGFMQIDEDSNQWNEICTNIFGSSQPFTVDDDNDDIEVLPSFTQRSSSKKSSKRESGFL